MLFPFISGATVASSETGLQVEICFQRETGVLRETGHKQDLRNQENQHFKVAQQLLVEFAFVRVLLVR